MGSTKFFHGASMLLGDATIPGVQMPEELKVLLPRIFQEVTNYGCEYFPTVVQMLTYDEISEIAAYGGFPVRFPHWKWGMEYEELQRGYEHGMHRIYEMVVNTNPCYIYCLDSNTLVDNVTVVAHALFHNDFFKNNIFFSPTSQNMMNELANHGTRIRKYMRRWGAERVTTFIDHVLRIETLIDASKAWDKKQVKDIIIQDQRTYMHPQRIAAPVGHDHMEEYLNPSEWLKKQQERIVRKEAAKELGLFGEPTKDIMGYMRDHAPLKPWQADIVAMLYEESMYFAPQRTTKMLNEGWASFGDYKMMCEKGLCGLGQSSNDSGIIEYSLHKMGVLGGKYSMNPYKLGYCIFNDIEERWNKGRFGTEYDNCTDMKEKENWDKKLGLGKEKVFDVRKHYNDILALNEFFTQEFCDKYEFFDWEKLPNGEIRIASRDHKVIKNKLINRYMNGGLPDVRLTESNYKGKGYLFLQHFGDGQIYEPYVQAVMQSLNVIWNNNIFLATKDRDGNEVVYSQVNPSDAGFSRNTREEHEAKM